MFKSEAKLLSLYKAVKRTAHLFNCSFRFRLSEEIYFVCVELLLPFADLCLHKGFEVPFQLSQNCLVFIKKNQVFLRYNVNFVSLNDRR